MAEQNKSQLKSYFNTGDLLTEENMIDLIDSFPNKKQLSVANPRSSGAEADVDTVGMGVDGSKWIKTGENDTDWKKIIIGDSSDQIPEDVFPDLMIAGIRQGTKEELDSADPPLLDNEPAWETDTKVLRVGENRLGGLPVIDLEDGVELAEQKELPIGQIVRLTEEGNRKLQYLGPVAGEKSGMLVEGGAETSLNGPYILSGVSNGKKSYSSSVGGGALYWDGSKWMFDRGFDVPYISNDDVETPDLATFQAEDASEPAPTVISTNTLHLDNFESIGSPVVSISLYITGSSTGTETGTCNGVTWTGNESGLNCGFVLGGSILDVTGLSIDTLTKVEYNIPPDYNPRNAGVKDEIEADLSGISILVPFIRYTSIDVINLPWVRITCSLS